VLQSSGQLESTGGVAIQAEGRDGLNRTSLPRLTAGRHTAVCAAAGTSDGTSTLRCPTGFHCYVSDQAQSELSETDDAAERVRLVSVASLAQAHSAERIAVLKIDAEGADFDVLRGAEFLLRERRIRFVIMEVSILWEHRRAAQTGGKVTKAHLQLPEVVDYLEANGGYSCFLIGPEVLIPLSTPWHSARYIYTEHQYNIVCAWREDPALRAVIQLYTTSPRATQFALAALAPASRMEPTCWACVDPKLGDASLRRAAAAAEKYFAAVYSRVDRQEWDLPHAHFMRARWLQATGRAEEALVAWEDLARQCCHEPADFQAARELNQLRTNFVAIMGQSAAKLLPSNRTAHYAAKPPWRQAADDALTIGWLHQRPGGGALFGREAACAAQAWFLRSASVGHEGGACSAALALQFGECAGRMTRKDLVQAARLYDRCILFQAQFVASGGYAGLWSVHSNTLKGLVYNLLATSPGSR